MSQWRLLSPAAISDLCRHLSISGLHEVWILRANCRKALGINTSFDDINSNSTASSHVTFTTMTRVLLSLSDSFCKKHAILQPISAQTRLSMYLRWNCIGFFINFRRVFTLESDSFNHEISPTSPVQNVRTFTMDDIGRLLRLKIKNIWWIYSAARDSHAKKNVTH